MTKRTWMALCAALMTLAAPGLDMPARAVAGSLPALQQGAQGAAVKELQAALNKSGFSAGPVDGQFGPKTLAAVQAFQRAHHLPATGRVDAATWTALLGQAGKVSAVTPSAAATAGGASGGQRQTTAGHVTAGAGGPTASGQVKVSQLRQIRISFQGKVISRPYAFTAYGTTYAPIWYLMNLLRSLGVQCTWDKTKLDLLVPKSMPLDLTGVHLGSGAGQPSLSLICMNGTPVARVRAIPYPDPYTRRATVYMPIWYLQQALKRVNIQYHWDGQNWSMTPGPRATYAAYRADGTQLGMFRTIQEAKQALGEAAGGVVKDSSGRVVYTVPDPVTYAVYG
ncbi:MAG: peptidoglycan-binding protein, partial [Alicyclobacillus sp.]|nr:peptidoglycan-binding protein [Alicyclobacillus sp.]